jgi:hypothetical protein
MSADHLAGAASDGDTNDSILQALHEVRNAVKFQTRTQTIHWALQNLEHSLAHHVSDRQFGDYTDNEVPDWKYLHLNRRTRFSDSLNPTHFMYYEGSESDDPKKSHVLAEHVLFAFLRGKPAHIGGRSMDNGMSEAGQKDFRDKFGHLLLCLTGRRHRFYEEEGRHMIAYE